jgi:5'-nucleotidase / UDP-sugar diphosphatase
MTGAAGEDLPMRTLALFGVSALLMGAAPVELTILHTNDIHGHILPWQGWQDEMSGKMIGGFDRLASAVRKVRAERPNVLLLDAGDTIADSMPAAETKGAVLTQLMNAVGYDAMTIGNHEPDFGPEALRQRVAESRFPVLAANLLQANSNTHFTKPYAIKTVGGLRVGMLGLAYPKTPLTTARKNVEGLEFREGVETAAKYVPLLRKEGVDVVIVLSQLGLSAEKHSAENVPGIDRIAGGHSHNRIREAMRVGSTLIVQAGAHLSDLGRLDLTVDSGKIVAHRRELILLDNDLIDSDEEVAAMLRSAQRRGEGRFAHASTPIIRAQTIAGGQPEPRHAQSPADSLFADLIRDKTGVDAVFLPGVGYGVAIQPGIIRDYDLRNLIPHESRVVTMTLTGGRIREILEQAVENVVTQDPAKKVGGMIQVSGIEFTWTEAGQKGTRVKDIRVASLPLDPAHRYQVATNSMLASGGHNYDSFLAGTDKKEAGPQFELIREAMANRKEVAAPADHRIRKADEAAHRVVIEVTSGESEQWESVLNNVQNLQKALTRAQVQIEVVAHGKALPMLMNTNTTSAPRIAEIANSGVRFAACENTMRRLNVSRSDLLPVAVTVPSGVAEIVVKQEAGWSYLKGGS